MFYLEVEMPSEPVIEEGFLYITRGVHLEFDPWLSRVLIDMHRDMVRLADPREPMALKDSEKQMKSNQNFKSNQFKISKGF